MDRIEIIAQYLCIALTGTVFAMDPNIATTLAFCICVYLWFTNKLYDRKLRIEELEDMIVDLQSSLSEQKAKTDELSRQLDSVRNVLQLKQLGR